MSACYFQCSRRANWDRADVSPQHGRYEINNSASTSNTESHCRSSHAICTIMDTNVYFLGLPPAVRERIYCTILPQSGFISDLNPQPDGFSIKVYRTAYNLMLTCRTMYFEVSPLLYSRNHMFIRFRDNGNLEPLRNLQPGSMASIHRLTIHLNVSSCEQGDACCDLALHVCDGEHDQPLGASPRYQTAI